MYRERLACTLLFFLGSGSVFPAPLLFWVASTSTCWPRCSSLYVLVVFYYIGLLGYPRKSTSLLFPLRQGSLSFYLERNCQQFSCTSFILLKINKKYTLRRMVWTNFQRLAAINTRDTFLNPHKN